MAWLNIYHFEGLEKGIDERFSTVNQRFDNMDQIVNQRFDNVDQRFKDLNKRIDILEQRATFTS